MDKGRFDSTVVAEAAEALSATSALSRKALWWESLLRGSAHAAVAQVAALAPSPQFDWGQLGENAWLLSASPQEVLAFKKGAEAMAVLAIARLAQGLGLNSHSLMENLEEHDGVEARIRSLVDEARRLRNSEPVR